MTLAHVAGVPVEEMLSGVPYVALMVGVAWAHRRGRR
jgi:hypothetical protein